MYVFVGMCRGQQDEKNEKTRTLFGPVQKHCTICREELFILKNKNLELKESTNKFYPIFAVAHYAKQNRTNITYISIRHKTFVKQCSSSTFKKCYRGKHRKEI